MALFDCWKLNGIFLNKRSVSGLHPAAGVQWGSRVEVRSSPTCTYMRKDADAPRGRCSSAPREAAVMLCWLLRPSKRSGDGTREESKTNDCQHCLNTVFIIRESRHPLRLQGRVWQACYFACTLSHVKLLAAPRTVAHQAPLSMGFSRQEYWSGLPFPSPCYFVFYLNWSSFNVEHKEERKWGFLYLGCSVQFSSVQKEAKASTLKVTTRKSQGKNHTLMAPW